MLKANKRTTSLNVAEYSRYFLQVTCLFLLLKGTVMGNHQHLQCIMPTWTVVAMHRNQHATEVINTKHAR